MKQIPINYKSDFNAILGLEGGWGVPFRASFWAGQPDRRFEASWDGMDTYVNCHREADGRMCFGFDNHGLHTGKLMLDLTFFIDNTCFADGICSEAIETFSPVFEDEDGVQYQVTLDYKGQNTITTIGTLPAFYQRGEKGEKGDPGSAGAPGAPGPQGPAGRDGRDGIDGKDGKDGSIIYPSVSIDAAGYLVAEIPDEAEGTNLSLDADGYLCVDFPDIK